MDWIKKVILTIFLLMQFFPGKSQAQRRTGTNFSGKPGNKALVFLIAGQSNAGGVAAFSPETNQNAGMQDKHPTNPGTTASEVGIPTDKDAYPRSYIWNPSVRSFEPLSPGDNLQTCYQDSCRHGIELPMAMFLEMHFPNGKVYFVKHGPAGHNLHTQWKAGEGPDYTDFIKQYTDAMGYIKCHHDQIQVVGLYWDQGESDLQEAEGYGENLRGLFAAFRKDTEIPDLQIYVRKHLFQHGEEDFAPIVQAQVDITNEDDDSFLLDLDLGSNEKNFKAWAWTDNNGHLSSKAYKELSGRIMALREKDEKVPVANDIELTGEQLQEMRKEWGPFVGPWKRYGKNPVIGLEDKETYSIQNGSQSVIKWKGQWYMFLMTSQPMVTKLAVSDDGLTWKRPHHNYLLKPEMEWEGSYNLAKVALLRDDEVWLYYFGKKDKRECIGLARSRDLLNWTKQPHSIFTSDSSNVDGTRVFPECVIKEGGLWYMYYDIGWGYYHPTHPDNYSIGVAVSRDGITWTDSPQSPVLTTSKSTAGSWDDGMVSQCSVQKIGEWYYMLYSGSTNKYGRQHAGKNRMAFGLARSKSPEGPWEKYPHNPVFKPTGNEGDFDGVFLQHPCPVKVGGQWRMYYNGWTKKDDAKNTIGAEYAIGVAFTDGTESTDSDR